MVKELIIPYLPSARYLLPSMSIDTLTVHKKRNESGTLFSENQDLQLAIDWSACSLVNCQFSLRIVIISYELID